MSDNLSSIRGLQASPAFGLQIAAKLEAIAALAVDAFGQAQHGASLLKSVANHAAGMPDDHPAVYTLFSCSSNERGQYAPGPDEVKALSLLAGDPPFGIPPENVVVELALLAGGNVSEQARDALQQAQTDAGLARVEIDRLTAVVAETQPLRDELDGVRAELAATAQELTSVREQLEFVRAGWAAQVKPPAKKPVKAAA
ncbi:hypothetical protein FSW04_17670 [Baekduia soli]|uniref:Uncharacterized protein n=1 Tax=Baekduia soli TaxID=496014 RepID=A0A5B8U8F1_9ACTN|nr:hypothetical protein [Baekduia soli]QEC49227.1 hypothetical protein FSW04_17670 [Baekduia soli]